MSSSDRSLKGKTLFITGASRGIGKAIALRAAKEGANIVLAAKTTTPHPKLPGTIFTAAKEVEEAGGKALPIKVDVRDVDSINAAVEEAVHRFGGIDILVNNASALWPRRTPEVPMKRYDLMQGVNTRGTFACTQACLPHLIESAKRGRNPHVLVLSPPLNMSGKWFINHTAYTISKMGMSMCVLGFSEEFKEYDIAVNALWPRTAIATMAVANVLAGDEGMKACRKVEIMSDAAYFILTSPSTKCTGNFFVDDKVLEAVGITDLEPYSVTPGTKNFLPDFFVEPNDGYGVGLTSSL